MSFITFTYRHRKEIIIGIIIFIVLSSLITTGVVYYLKLEKNNKKEDIIVEDKNELIKKAEDKEKKEILYKVDIKGQIITPGIYTLKPSARVIDVINEAGGLTDIADTSVINLSKKITDEMVIIVYSKEQVANFSKVKEIGEAKANDIIKYREENGPFESIEDLKKVPGIGDNLFAQIKEDITT